MPLNSFGAKPAILTKNPRGGNRDTFSNGKKSVVVTAWKVWDSTYRRQTVPQAKLYSEETVCVVRTHDRFAIELQTDDSLTFNGYTYSVQSIHTVETPIGRKKDYEVELA